MKVSNLVGDRFKERPSDCLLDSHALTVRGGYIKGMANGIFSLFYPMRAITHRIENIIREEMNRIDGQEVLFPVVMPGSLWRESGRYDSIGSELLRFRDRSGADMVLGMTHEEAAVHLVRSYGQTYTKYPFMIYQIQTKFRDEPRSRGGLIRVREFTMKDAYSFHTSEEDMKQYYERCYKAYERIFARAGVPEVVAVLSDSGMMGGAVSHEFMLLTPVGEDSIAICKECGYSSNMEVAATTVENANALPKRDIELVHTPDCSVIDDVTKTLSIPVENTCKAVVFQKNSDDSFVVAFLRGDLEANDTKISHCIGEAVHPAEIADDSQLVAGFIGPYKLKDGFTLLFDKSLDGVDCMSCGANRRDYHYIGFNLERDFGKVDFVDIAKIPDGGICPVCGKHAISLTRGIEVGNIFQLGQKYTKSMGMTYTDAEGNLQYPIMGCYGIGVGRLAASVCEAHHDDYGPIWPISIAPWQVEICCLRSDDEKIHAYADELYSALTQKGFEVLYDDRDVRPGVMFSDADLLGAPIRLVVSSRNLDEGCVELVTRDKRVNEKVLKGEVVERTQNLAQQLYDEIEATL